MNGNRPELVPIPILGYHSVCDRPDTDIAPFSVRPADFARHLDTIVERGMRSFTISEFSDVLAEGGQLPPRPVLITFDDGWVDTLTVAGPMLAERGLVGTVYVTTGTLPGCPGSDASRDSMIPYSRLAELEALGLEVSSHTHTHPELDVITAAAATSDVVRGKDLLESALAHTVRSFAYPYGYASNRVRDIVRGAGFDSACGVRNAFTHATDDRFLRARLTVRSRTSVAEIGRWLDGIGAPLAAAHQQLRTSAWRTWRRVLTVRPRSLVVSEVATAAFGPIAYLRSRRDS